MRELVYVETEPGILALSEEEHSTVEQTILREGTWKHPGAPGGKLAITKDFLRTIKDNFDHRVGLGGDKIPFHFGHTENKDETAVAWGDVNVEDDPDRPGKQRLVSRAKFTSPAYRDKVVSGQYQFTSPTILFNYEDKELNKRYPAIVRNVAFTNYPYLKQMGPAKVLNLSDVPVSAGNGGNATGMDFNTGGPAAGEPNFDGLPKGYELEELPKQCTTCAQLGNDCPFAEPEAEDDLQLKQAAASAGNCPQYVEADSEVPGGGGPSDMSMQSPAAGRRVSPDRVQASDIGGMPIESGPPTLFGSLNHSSRDPIISGPGDLRLAGGPEHTFARTNYNGDWPVTDYGGPFGKGHGAIHDEPIKGLGVPGEDSERHSQTTWLHYKAPDGHSLHITHDNDVTDPHAQAWLKTMDAKGNATSYHQHTNPAAAFKFAKVWGAQHGMSGGAPPLQTAKPNKKVSLSDNGRPAPRRKRMNDLQAKRAAEKLAAYEVTEKQEFTTRLSETYNLPASAVKDVIKIFDDGSALSVQLSEALQESEAEFVRLSDDDIDAKRPSSLDIEKSVDLSDMVTVSRSALRKAFETVAAAERVDQVKLSDTRAINKPGDDKEPSTTAEFRDAVNKESNPKAALALLRKATEDNKL